MVCFVRASDWSPLPLCSLVAQYLELMPQRVEFPANFATFEESACSPVLSSFISDAIAFAAVLL